MALAGDDEVIVQAHAERLAGVADFLGHFDVGLRRRRIAARVYANHCVAALHKILSLSHGYTRVHRSLPTLGFSEECNLVD